MVNTRAVASSALNVANHDLKSKYNTLIYFVLLKQYFCFKNYPRCMRSTSPMSSEVSPCLFVHLFYNSYKTFLRHSIKNRYLILRKQETQRNEPMKRIHCDENDFVAIWQTDKFHLELLVHPQICLSEVKQTKPSG